MQPKISIIVPVYKVERYLKKCLDSILVQTFSDFELILIDDGSPDNSGKICDEYAKKDSRIVVIHKENQGAAMARNVGLDRARGEYIGFVDSDDWIEKDMYELLYSLCKQYDCDIVNCSSIICYKNRVVVNGGHSFVIHDQHEAMKTLLIGEMYDECLWTKLIKREIIGTLRLPTNVSYEDTAFMYHVFERAHKVGAIGQAKYHYIKHDDSVMDRALKNISIDAMQIYEEMYGFIKEKYPDLVGLVVYKLCNNGLSLLNLMIQSWNFKEHKKKYLEVSKILNRHFRETIKLKEYPKNVKILLILLRIHSSLYKLAIRRLQKRAILKRW